MRDFNIFSIPRFHQYFSEIGEDKLLKLSDKKWSELIDNIQSLEEDWNKFSESLEEISICGRVINRSALANPYSLRTEINMENSKDSLVICLSSLGEFYGFYYYSFSKEAAIPIRYYSKDFRDYSKIIEKVDSRISYFPFSEGHVEATLEVEKQMKRWFPRFEKLDPFTAHFKVENIMIQEEFYPKLDLFQLIFIYEPVAL
ncbi:hypothetical protein [Aquiflexum gelatinilyticum]|uniref:Uncharacterized protein n=1 Tax=Aquiflexum gelatinilyticum TaxID=2961943 RepID=A0A9X2P4D8_9BACT|nr:hypothetical protein [Aquiflexum gelatinilyticum]MCR9015067.1 hypothetical protein [Aquiflexum gelatinilyticum]